MAKHVFTVFPMWKFLLSLSTIGWDIDGDCTEYAGCRWVGIAV